MCVHFLINCLFYFTIFFNSSPFFCIKNISPLPHYIDEKYFCSVFHYFGFTWLIPLSNYFPALLSTFHKSLLAPTQSQSCHMLFRWVIQASQSFLKSHFQDPAWHIDSSLHLDATYQSSSCSSHPFQLLSSKNIFKTRSPVYAQRPLLCWL